MTFLVFLLFFNHKLGIDETWWETASKKYFVYGILLVAYSSIFILILLIYYTKSIYVKHIEKRKDKSEELLDMGTNEKGLKEYNFKIATNDGKN